MQFESVNRMLYSDTALPDIFIAEYMPNMSGESVKLYIACVYFAKNSKSCTREQLAKYLSMDVKGLDESLVCLESMGLVIMKSGKIVLNDIKEMEINKLYTPKLTSAPFEAISGSEKNNKVAKVISQINKSFFSGMMPPSWYGDIHLMFIKYKFEEDVMFALFKCCNDEDKLTKPYLKKVAENWNKSGVTNLNDLDRYSRDYEQYKSIQGAIYKKLKRKSAFTEYEEEYIRKWINEYKYGFDIIDAALRKTVGKLEASIKYVDAILTSWYKDGVKKVEEIEEKDSKFKKTTSTPKKKYDDDFYDSLYNTVDKDKK